MLNRYIKPILKVLIGIAFVIVAFGVFLFIFSLCYLSPFKGKVIDAETKTPIEGAAVLIVYWREDPCTYKAKKGAPVNMITGHETTTDKNGEFDMSRRFEPCAGPFRLLGGVKIFKPGFGLFPNHQRSTASGEKQACSDRHFLPKPKQHIVYELPRLYSKEERKINVLHAGTYGVVPYEKKKTYWELVNQERRYVGLHIRVPFINQ